MPVISFINGQSVENDVSSAQQLPTTAIDGYTTATAYVVTLPSNSANVALVSVVGAKSIDIMNNTGQDLEFRRGSASVYAPIPQGTFRSIGALGGNANSISIRIPSSVANANTVSLVYEVLS